MYDDNTTPHSARPNHGPHGPQVGPGETLTVTHEDMTWTVDLPGVNRFDIRVFTVKDKLYVNHGKVIRGNTHEISTHIILDEGEKVHEARYANGRMTIVIDLPHKPVNIEFE